MRKSKGNPNHGNPNHAKDGKFTSGSAGGKNKLDRHAAARKAIKEFNERPLDSRKVNSRIGGTHSEAAKRANEYNDAARVDADEAARRAAFRKRKYGKK